MGDQYCDYDIIIIGAEVSGIDISKPLDEDVLGEVNKALLEHQVIFFRDQKMGLERHKAFGLNLVLYIYIRPQQKLMGIQKF